MKYCGYLIVFFLLFMGEVRADMICVKDKVCFDVEIVKDEKDLMRGLMFVKSMPRDKGMLFDFRAYNPRDISMWMKNTYISLDMIFIDCDGRIVDVKENARPLSLEYIKSEKKFCYVLEVNGGEFKERGLEIGDRFDMN